MVYSSPADVVGRAVARLWVVLRVVVVLVDWVSFWGAAVVVAVAAGSDVIGPCLPPTEKSVLEEQAPAVSSRAPAARSGAMRKCNVFFMGTLLHTSFSTGPSGRGPKQAKRRVMSNNSISNG